MSAVLPQHCLRLISKEDRAKLKLGMTAEEALEAYEFRTEREFQEILVQWLMVHRGVNRVVRSRMDRRSTHVYAGDPDFLFLYKSIPMAWEIKLATGKLSLAQERAQVAFLKDGWNYSVIRSFAQARAILDGERVV